MKDIIPSESGAYLELIFVGTDVPEKLVGWVQRLTLPTFAGLRVSEGSLEIQAAVLEDPKDAWHLADINPNGHEILTFSVDRDDILRVAIDTEEPKAWLFIRDPTGIMDEFVLKFESDDGSNPMYAVKALAMMLRTELGVRVSD